MILRPYQAAAKAAVYEYLRAHNDNPCVVIPTAGGKTPVLASICADAVLIWQGRVLVLAHVRELLQQAAEKLTAVAPGLRFGVYSAGLRRRDTEAPVIVAGIQSVYKRACELGPFDLIIVDEAHLIPAEGDGMYRQFIADARVVNPHLRVVGFTATPFRLKTGLICAPDNVLNAVCYDVGVRELIRDGYLCPLVTRAGASAADTDGLHSHGGEFVADEAEDLMDQEGRVEAACAEVMAHTACRKAILIFATGVRHGRHVVDVVQQRHGVECGFVCAGTPAAERDALLKRFKAGDLNYLCNVNVLTTGFDAPNVDAVVLLRPTLSPGLYYQMVGRGFRLHPGKADCLVLDFGGNVLRHGPVDQLQLRERTPREGDAPVKECPACQAFVATGYARCPHCGYEFPERRQRPHDVAASDADILSGKITTTRYEVLDVRYFVHAKRGAEPDDPRSMRVEYWVGWHTFKSEWVCFEHGGYARAKAEAWWRARSPDPVPATAERAVVVADCGGVALTTAITVRKVSGERHERIIGHEIAEMSEAIEVVENGITKVETTEEVPF